MKPWILSVLLFCSFEEYGNGFVNMASNGRVTQAFAVRGDCNINNDSADERSIVSRSDFFNRVIIASVAAIPVVVGDASGAFGEDIIWQTGKMPIIPGQKTKDKSDVSGTRKDPNFLRSLADCKSQCEKTSTPEGYAKPKEECLSDCQDICCTTYQQCTFGIVPRI